MLDDLRIALASAPGAVNVRVWHYVMLTGPTDGTTAAGGYPEGANVAFALEALAATAKPGRGSANQG